MWASFGSLSVVPWILFAQIVLEHGCRAGHHRGTARHPRSRWKSETAPKCSAAVRSDEHGRRCSGSIAHTAPRSSSRRSSHSTGHGSPTSPRRRARMAGAEQLYILVAGGERDVGVIAARHGPASRLTDQQRESIRRAFLGPLQAGEADEALDQGVRAIGTTLDSAAASRPRLGGRDALIAVAILVAALAVLLASQTRAWYEDRSRRRRRAAGATAPGPIGGPPSAGATVPRVLQATPTTDMRGPLRTARSSARCREKVEA